MRKLILIFTLVIAANLTLTNRASAQYVDYAAPGYTTTYYNGPMAWSTYYPNTTYVYPSISYYPYTTYSYQNAGYHVYPGYKTYYTYSAPYYRTSRWWRPWRRW